MEGINKLTSSSATMSLVLMAVMVVCASSSTDQTHQPDDDISCSEAIQTMEPCEEFLSGWGPYQPSIECCFSASILSALVTTPETRKAMCQCFKGVHSSPQSSHRIEHLRQACAEALPIPSDPKQDCSKFLWF